MTVTGADGRAADIDRGNALHRRILVGREEEAVALVPDVVPLVLEAGEERDGLRAGPAQVDDMNVVLVPGLAGRNDQPVAVVADLRDNG